MEDVLEEGARADENSPGGGLAALFLARHGGCDLGQAADARAF